MRRYICKQRRDRCLFWRIFSLKLLVNILKLEIERIILQLIN